MPTTNEVACPTCGGAMWDNRETKRNPKAPDYKCKTKTCDGAVWPPKNGAAAVASPVTHPTTKQPFTAGGTLPYEREERLIETGAPPADATPAAARLASLFKLHAACITHAVNVANEIEEQHRIKADLCGISALAAQVFIAATKNGV